MAKRRAIAACLAGASAVIGLGAMLARRDPPGPPAAGPDPSGFTFCTMRGDASGSPTKGEEVARPLVLALVLGVPTEHAASLVTALDEANRRWEARANPFTDDLEEGDPDESLVHWLSDGPPAAMTATAAMRRRACAADGVCVVVVGKGRPCPSGHALAGGKDLERARFMAWPLGHAVWLRARDGAESLQFARALRARAAGESAIGLVLHAADDDELERVRPEVRDRLLRHEALRRTAALRETNEVAGAPDESGAFPVELSDEDVLVLPRLAAIRDPTALEREVRGTVPGAEVRAVGRER